MTKITSEQVGDFKGTVYLMKFGYTYKITYHRKVVDQSYVYFRYKDMCVEKMRDMLKVLAGFNKDLFDLERLR